MTLQDRLNNIKEYFQSMELIDNKWVLCVKYHSKWGAFPSKDEKIQVTPDESSPYTFWYYSDDNTTTIDEILDLVDETIKTNLDAIKKVELFKVKGEELKQLFSDENISFSRLQTLKFVMDEESAGDTEMEPKFKPKKNKKVTQIQGITKTISKKKKEIEEKTEFINVGERNFVEEGEKNNQNDTKETQKKVADNGICVDACDLTQSEIDDLRG